MLKSSIGLTEFLQEYSGMSLAPATSSDIVLRGTFSFSAIKPQGLQIDESFNLRIVVPHDFPKKLPKVWETAKRIPSVEGFHLNPDNSLCLGSPIRLLGLVSSAPTLNGYVSKCLIPYLYAISLKLKTNEPLYMGELSHGARGLLEDYKQMMGLNTDEAVVDALELLGTKKRLGNKSECPCGCGKRLGRCNFRNTINKLRAMSYRKWFKEHAALMSKK